MEPTHGATAPAENENQQSGGVEIPAEIADLPSDEPAAPEIDTGGGLGPGAEPDESQPADGPAWKREPLRNFQTDGAGNIKFHASGEPKRRKGRKSKPRPGDQLADGTTYTDIRTDNERPAIITPESGKSDEKGERKEGAEFGPEAGRLIARIVTNTAQAIGGAKYKPTDDERKTIEQAAGAATTGRRLPWLLVLPLVVAAYIFARIDFSRVAEDAHQKAKREQAQTGNTEDQKASDGRQTHSDNGKNGKRKDAARAKAGTAGIAWG